MKTLTIRRGETVKTVSVAEGKNLLDVLAENGVFPDAPCGGRGTCGKCRVTVNGREVLACRTVITGDAEIVLPAQTESGLAAGSVPDGCGAAVDLGTTTVAVTLVENGKAESRVFSNPQRVYGADVASRITACRNGKLPLLTTLIRDAVRNALNELCGTRGLSRLPVVTVCGNPTMLHLFAGVDPAPLGVAPFTPVFLKTRLCPEAGLPAEKVYLLPSVSGYLGSDAVCGVLARRLTDGKKRLLADLGTNGELVLSDGKHLFAASTAAGPALEGASLSCGSGGVGGAIKAVTYEGGVLRCETVGDLPPVSLCGSGLVDLIALLLRAGLIDKNGAFDRTSLHPLKTRLTDDRFLLTDKVWLTSDDVRQFLLAKAAIRAAIGTLCRFAGVAVEDIASFELAGGLGTFLRPESALAAGLLPPQAAGKVTAVGNASLAGALLCFSPDERDRAEKTASAVRVCVLNEQETFERDFLDALTFR